jgi:hypothetical protein
MESLNGEEPVPFLLGVIRQHRQAKLERHRDVLRAIGAINDE